MNDDKPPSDPPKVYLASRDDYKEFEYEAALAYARTLNRLDPQPLKHLLSDTCVYESQNVLNSIRGKDQILDYLQKKCQTIREASHAHQVFAQLGKMTEIYIDRPCVLLAQGTYDNLVAVVLFEVDKGKIVRIDICTVLPNPTHAKGTGEYPE